MYETDILTDKSERSFAYSDIDLAIPLNKCEKLREVMKKIRKLASELDELSKEVDHVYAHCYIKISSDSKLE